MKISFEKPPVWDECNKVFDLHNLTPVFTYGDTLYNPFKCEIPDHLIVHEETHMKQQNYNDADARIWWGRYLTDVHFRVTEEVEAYSAQYKFICLKVKDRNMRAKYLHQLAAYLSGPMYGNAVTQVEATRMIRG